MGKSSLRWENLKGNGFLMDDLEWKRVVNANLKRSNEILEKEIQEFYTKLYDLCSEFKTKVHEDHVQLDARTLGKSADLVLLGILARFTANWSLRLSDKTTKEYDWQMTPEQAKHLTLDFFSQLYDHELELETEFIKEQAANFMDLLKSSKMVKAVGEKQEKLKAKIKAENVVEID